MKRSSVLLTCFLALAAFSQPPMPPVPQADPFDLTIPAAFTLFEPEPAVNNRPWYFVATWPSGASNWTAFVDFTGDLVHWKRMTNFAYPSIYPADAVVVSNIAPQGANRMWFRAGVIWN